MLNKRTLASCTVDGSQCEERGEHLERPRSQREDRVQFTDWIFISTLVAQQSLLFELCLEGKQTLCCARKWTGGGKKDLAEREEAEVQIMMRSVGD